MKTQPAQQHPQSNPAPAWTPGPWEVSPTSNPSKEFGISAADGTIIARLDYWHDEAEPEMDANARLIAAAPEMAEALSKCANMLDVAFDCEDDAFGVHHNDAGDALLVARAILARLHGEGGGV